MSFFAQKSNLAKSPFERNRIGGNYMTGTNRIRSQLGLSGSDALYKTASGQYISLADRNKLAASGQLGAFNQFSGTAGGGNLIDQFQKAMDDANAANRARQQKIEDLLAQTGEQERMDIRQKYNELGTQSMQGLTSRGLSASTVAPTMMAGIAREETSALGRLEDRLRNTRAGFLERINETGPDWNMLMQLGMMQGRGGGGGFSMGGGRRPRRRSRTGSTQQDGIVGGDPFGNTWRPRTRTGTTATGGTGDQITPATNPYGQLDDSDPYSGLWDSSGGDINWGYPTEMDLEYQSDVDMFNNITW